MAEKVGDLYYDVSLETSGAIRQSRAMQQENARTGASFDALTPKLSTITRAISVYAAALTLVKAARLADDVRLLGARVEVAAGSVEKGAAALSELQRISARTQTELSANAGVFNRLNQSILQMGGAQTDTLRITELLGKAIKVSGASGVEASSAMTQFGQALGSGKLAGDELRSLLENAPYLMRQLADGIGVPIGALKQLGEDGKLTADVVVNALSKAAEKIDSDFKRLPATFQGAMASASDAAARANEALDTLTGTSAALTGATKGVGDVLDALARQFAEATTEGDRLSRGDTVKTWADNTALALSYVVDGADFVARGFRQMGTAIGGVAASIGALARGELGQARDIMAMMAKDVQAIGAGPLAGARMRDARAANAANGRVEDRGFTPATAGSVLRSPAGAGGDAKKRGKFDADGYMAGLREGTLEGMAQIDAVETEAMRQAAERLKERQITYAQYAEAINLIQTKAAQERLEIQTKEAEDLAEAFRKADEANIAAEQKSAEQRARGQGIARDTIGAADPIAALQFELEEKSAMLRDYAARDLENMNLYAQALVALEQQTADKIAEIVRQREQQKLQAQSQVLQGYGQMFGSVADMAKAFGGEQDKTYRVMFAASKAFAIADSIVKIQQGIANALALPYPANIAAAASTAAQAAGIVGTIKSASYGGGRQYGGPVSSGTMYRVNETGRPEMFTAANGAQYMLPTSSGSVTSARDVAGAGVQWTINVHNAPPGTTATVDQESRVIDIAVAQAEARVSQGITERRGPVWRALGTTNVRGQQ